MPQQLIYTSAPRGIVAGRSGYCTVARSAGMREALMLQLEKFSYYQHLSLSGGRERPIFTCRVTDIRGSRFHVLSRLRDAGLDFTGRTNFIAHHLVFAPEEIRHFAVPPVILRDWPGWKTSWSREPEMLPPEDWTTLHALADRPTIPARTWQQVTGDAVNGFGLLEARAGASFRVDDVTDETVLGLFAESLALLEIRDPRRDGRLTAWSHTFTTSLQEQDNPSDFRWRCLHSDNPGANRSAPPDCRALSAVRAARGTAEEAGFARTGRQPPQFTAQPQDLRIVATETARFTARAEGVPLPAYQWFSVDRSGCGTVLPGETNPELVITNPALGTTRYRVTATNSSGTATSVVAVLSVDEKARLAVPGRGRAPDEAKSVVYQKSEEEIDRQRRKIAEASARAAREKRRWWQQVFLALGCVLALPLIGVGLYWKRLSPPPNARPAATNLVSTAAKPPLPANTNSIVTTNNIVPPVPHSPPAQPPAPTIKPGATTQASNGVEMATPETLHVPANPPTETKDYLKPP